MTDINQALSLYDMANQIDRLRFQMRALPASIPSVSAAFAPVHTLTGIITAVSDEVSRRLAGHISSDEAKAIDAFGDAFIPLGEAVTELGRMHSEVAFFNFTTYPTHSGSSPDLERLTRRSEEVISGCREAADAILETAAGELRAAAVKLAPSPTRVRATTPSPHATDTRPSLPAPTSPPPPAGPGVTPRAAKSR
ncbi:hypothetical protein AB0C52_25100 [Streptomyces sp. NPDC048717]|uniref:hypothetical protein n=1 Tax=Streptomyces sp. NPDC048717 TaxID=3154928 RepID=UPI003443746A